MRAMDRLTLPIVVTLSVAAFAWPLLIGSTTIAASGAAQFAFLILMPALVALLFIHATRHGLDAREIGLLGVLIGVNSVARLLGAGTAGLETVFFLILIGGYAFGPAFGYLIGAGSLLVSALISGGVGPWLPYQMMAAGLLGLLAGMLPKPSSMVARRVTLATFAVPAAYLYGALMTLWNWPFLAGAGGTLGYRAGAGIGENLTRFIGYEFATGGILWDTGRAVITVVLVWLTAPALLTTLNRAARRAGFEN